MISVIIPTLNEDKLLAATLGQFPPELRAAYDLELIVSDGGSSDCTLTIAESAEVRLIRHELPRRQTIAEGRNAGATAAQGELLFFLNADTRFRDADLFFREIRRTMSDERVLAATCAVQIFPEEEQGIDRLFHYCHNGYCRLLNFIGEGMGRGECQIVRRAVFDRIGGYNPLMAAGEDFDLFRRIRRLGRIAFLRGTVIYESPRRFRRYGYGHIVWGWTKNAVAVIARNRSSSQEWEAVR